ncbi:MAG: GatB/YqeY domain-containing protein [Desulfobulbaceae bacterium]
MGLQSSIHDDLKKAMKAKDEARISALRVMLGEFQRQGKKELDDGEVVAIIRKLIKAERETLDRTGQATSPYLEIIESYQPRQAGEEEIQTWIAANIDFSQLKNKMQAMRPIMAHFGSAADGDTVKKVLESF